MRSREFQWVRYNKILKDRRKRWKRVNARWKKDARARREKIRNAMIQESIERNYEALKRLADS